MKYTSKDIQNILTSKTAINGLDYITPIYQEAKIALWIMEAMGLEVDLIVKWIEEIVQQILPQTADWALNYWEQEYDLPVHPDIPIEERREKVLTAVRTRAPMNPEKLEEVLEIIFKIEKAKQGQKVAAVSFKNEDTKNTFFSLTKIIENVKKLGIRDGMIEKEVQELVNTQLQIKQEEKTDEQPDIK